MLAVTVQGVGRCWPRSSTHCMKFYCVRAHRCAWAPVCVGAECSLPGGWVASLCVVDTGCVICAVCVGVARSDVPIRFSKKMRQKLIAASKFKGLADVPKFLKGLSLKDLAPEAPAIAEFSTGEVMGHSRCAGLRLLCRSLLLCAPLCARA